MKWQEGPIALKLKLLGGTKLAMRQRMNGEPPVPILSGALGSFNETRGVTQPAIPSTVCRVSGTAIGKYGPLQGHLTGVDLGHQIFDQKAFFYANV